MFGVSTLRNARRASLLAACFASSTLSAGVYLNVRNSPSLSITTTNLAAGAGSDLTSTQTVTTQQLLDINVYGFNSYTWEVDIAFSTTGMTWPSGATVTAKRTSNGGNSNIAGGTSAMQLTSSAQPLFTGKGDATGVSIQYVVSGLNLSNCSPGNNYSFPIRFTYGVFG